MICEKCSHADVCRLKHRGEMRGDNILSCTSYDGWREDDPPENGKYLVKTKYDNVIVAKYFKWYGWNTNSVVVAWRNIPE